MSAFVRGVRMFFAHVLASRRPSGPGRVPIQIVRGLTPIGSPFWL